MTDTITPEAAAAAITAASILTKNQKKHFGPKHLKYGDTSAVIVAEVRFDCECGNGHNTFSITGTVRATDRRINPRDGGFLAGGCLHEEIAKRFPELAPFIKWHLCNTGGPHGYIENTRYFAGNRDCWGKLAGEPKNWETSIQFGDNPIKYRFPRHPKFVKFLQEASKEYDFEVLPIYHEDRPGESYKFGPKYTFGGYAEKWHECPFDSEGEALDFLKALQTCNPQFVTVATAWGEGKVRELDKARHSAVWPEATDEDLTAPGLEDRLRARLPQLLADFRRDVESLGFTW